MKRTIIILSSLFAILSADAQIRIGGRKIDTKKAVKAAGDMATGRHPFRCRHRTVEPQIGRMDGCPQPSGYGRAYDRRLRRLTEGITEADGIPLNFKVYLVIDVNAFACGDGSIRVFSSLMDLMTDDELMAIIGHEIGHIVHADVKHAMKNAYLASAARNAAGAAEEAPRWPSFPNRSWATW